jgi:uncharacterized membrane protein
MGYVNSIPFFIGGSMLMEYILLGVISFTSGDITYTKDVKPIFERRCSQCHNANWPDKNWLDYNKAKENKDKIKIKVKDKTMPPGNSTEITEEERNIIIQWVDDGAKK